MRIGVTGGTGFIGRHLVQRLRPWADLMTLEGRMECLDPDSLRASLEGAEVVIHLAGIKGRRACAQDVRKAIAVNVTATAQLLSAAREAGVQRFFFCSTYAVYGRRDRSELPNREEDEIRPCDVYGMTKALAEGLIQSEPIDSTILRLGHVYGLENNDRDPDVVSRFLRSAAEGQPIRIRGSGDRRIDPIHVEDVCECLELLLKNPRKGKELYNLTGGASLTVRQVAEKIQQVAQGQGLPLRIVQEGLDDPAEFDTACSIDRIRAALPGFSPRRLADRAEEILKRRGRAAEAALQEGAA